MAVTSRPPALDLAAGEYLDAGGYATHYHETGAGDTVLLIHGSGPGVSAWANWRLVIPNLAARFHVVAPDLLGFGYSERPAGVTYSKDVWIDHLIAFLDAKGVARTSVIGNSLGGALALGLAVKRPGLVERMVLMGSAGIDFPITEGLDAVWGYEPSVENMRHVISEYFAADRSIATDDLVRLRYEASIQPGFQESYGSMFPAPRQDGVRALTTPPEQIARIEAPTLLIHGRDDKVIPLATSMTLLNTLPNAELHVFGKCGHWVQIERSAEFNELASSFFSRGARR
jgi:2-hydroxymuconate-semialdehyde hydrolase